MDRKERERAAGEEGPKATETLGRVPTREPDFPELTKIRAHDRQLHIQKAIEMGMTREEAERHADDELAERWDARE